MTVSARSISSPRELFRWTRLHSVGAFVAIAALFVAWTVQVSLLTAWHWSLPASRISLAPMNAAVAADTANNTLTYSFFGGPAVSASKTINVATDSVLAVDVTLDRVPPQTTLTLGWVGTRDRRKPSNLAVSLPPSEAPQTLRVLLRGHSQWRDSITQVAFALVSRPGNPPVTLSDAQWVSATPGAATAVAWGHWFDGATQLKPSSVNQRVLPLAALLLLAVLCVAAAIAWFKRGDAVARRDALVGASIVFVVLAVALTFFSTKAWTINAAMPPWCIAALAVCFALCEPARLKARVMRAATVADLLAMALAAASVLVGGLGFIWVVLVIGWCVVAKHVHWVAARAQPFVFFLPALAIGAVVQAAHAKQLALPASLTADPSSSFASALHAAAGLPALVIAMLVMHAAWPRTSGEPRDARAGIALWLTLLGASVGYAWALAQPQPASVGVVWVLLPLLVAATAWLAPKFFAPLEAANAIAVSGAKRETDLSNVVRQLFDGTAASFDAALVSDHAGTALSPLKRMREIAPASTITHAAELRYALKNGETEFTREAYAQLHAAPQSALTSAATDALMDYAFRKNDFELLRERAPLVADAARSTYFATYAALLGASDDGGPDAALAMIASLDEAVAKANGRTIVELHLLKDDWRAAQAALETTGIPPQSILGDAYVSRLGLRATQASGYVEKIQKLVTWQNTMGAAHAAMGELLLMQGNPSGAKARFLLAMQLDRGLWPLRWRVQQIERIEDRTPDAIEHAAAVSS